MQVAKAGAHVVSTCEELAYPWTAQPQLAAELDAAARRAGVTLLGTGVNPGYAMDALPLMLTAPCAAVRGVRVLRVVDAARRRGPLQRKVGAGLTPAEFEARVKMARCATSACPSRCICWPPGWAGGWTRWMIRSRRCWPITPISTEFVEVAAGQVAGVRQVARGFIERSRGAEPGAANVRRRARPARLQSRSTATRRCSMTIAGGLHGDVATAAIVLNAASSVMRAAPGLASMAEVPLVHFW